MTRYNGIRPVVLHEIRFSHDRLTGEEVATCSCGWQARSQSLTEVELRASVHDLDQDTELK